KWLPFEQPFFSIAKINSSLTAKTIAGRDTKTGILVRAVIVDICAVIYAYQAKTCIELERKPVGEFITSQQIGACIKSLHLVWLITELNIGIRVFGIGIYTKCGIRTKTKDHAPGTQFRFVD